MLCPNSGAAALGGPDRHGLCPVQTGKARTVCPAVSLTVPALSSGEKAGPQRIHLCCVSTQGPQPSEDQAYVVC